MQAGNQRGWHAQQQAPIRTISDVWGKPYLAGGYFDERGNLRPELVEREPLERLAREMAQDRPSLTSTQVRRYFGHCRAIETQILAESERDRHEKWLGCYKDLMITDAVAAKAREPGKEKIPQLFADYITINVKAAKTSKDFLEGFIYHFEALVGFGSQHFKK